MHDWSMPLRAAVSAKTGYHANAVEFDGTNDYLTRGAALTGIADGKTGTLSLWFNMQGDDGSNLNLLTNQGNFFFLRRVSDNTMRIQGANSAGTVILTKPTQATHTAGAGWKHGLVAWDLAAGLVHFYVDDAEDEQAAETVTDDTINYDRSDWSVGASVTGGGKVPAYLADVWFDTQYIDITVEANRRKFISSALKPVFLGADGSRPTGTPPKIFLSGITADWHTNKGSGGGFTENGALTDAATSPSS